MLRRSDVSFGAPHGGKAAPQRSSRGRTCEQNGCCTLLSTYNSSSHCWVHAAPSYKRSPRPAA
jgi:hypothetical protein